MLIGKYYHTIESAGRVSLPKPFRSFSKQWVVTRGFDGCLFLLPEDHFTEELEKINQRSFTQKDTRDLVRLLANEAQTVTPDKLGRVQLPEYLIKYAHLDKHVVLVGSVTRVELWERETYHAYIHQLEPHAEELAEKYAE
ncbi:division/cell wall cluster transcriptional repressor MraZ [Candidatus Woesebacteria bacterium]|nr:division/cell wall cluster transcriptional repressor MraZ [Candidatus Woesebacteria bacterium]